MKRDARTLPQAAQEELRRTAIRLVAEITARGTVTASTRGDAGFAAIVAGLDSAGIAVTELSLHLPSLDEVFSALTRKETRGRVFEEVAA